MQRFLGFVGGMRDKPKNVCMRGYICGLQLVEFDPFCLFILQGLLVIIFIMINDS